FLARPMLREEADEVGLLHVGDPERQRLAHPRTHHSPPTSARWSRSIQRSITTVSPAARALAAASSWTTPSCIHTAFAPTAIAPPTTAGTASGLRNTSTTSIFSGTSRRLGYDRSPSTCATVGFTGMMR